jgi:hypothetical protein
MTLMTELIELSQMPPVVEQTPREQAIALLERLVAKYGFDYIYPYSAASNTFNMGCLLGSG